MPKGPIKSTLAAKKARKLVTTEGSKRLEKKAAKKELKSASAKVQRSFSQPTGGSSAVYHRNLTTIFAAAERADTATKRAVDANVSTKAANKAIDKGKKMVLKGQARRKSAQVKATKKSNEISKKFGI